MMDTYLDGLEAIAKSMARLAKEIINRVKSFLSNIVAVAKDLFESLPKQPNKEYKGRPFPNKRHTNGKQLKRFMLIKKPKTMCIRSNC